MGTSRPVEHRRRQLYEQLNDLDQWRKCVADDEANVPCWDVPAMRQLKEDDSAANSLCCDYLYQNAHCNPSKHYCLEDAASYLGALGADRDRKLLGTPEEV